MEKFASTNDTNTNDNTACPYPTSPEGFTGYILDFGMKLLTNAGLFGIIFLIFGFVALFICFKPYNLLSIFVTCL